MPQKTECIAPMISCVYTSDKNKKNKVWKEGFIKANGRYLNVYNSERAAIYSFRHESLSQEEYVTPKYLIYIEGYSKLGKDNIHVHSISKNAAHTSGTRCVQDRGGRSVKEILDIIDSIENTL